MISYCIASIIVSDRIYYHIVSYRIMTMHRIATVMDTIPVLYGIIQRDKNTGEYLFLVRRQRTQGEDSMLI